VASVLYIAAYQCWGPDRVSDAVVQLFEQIGIKFWVTRHPATKVSTESPESPSTKIRSWRVVHSLTDAQATLYQQWIGNDRQLRALISEMR
jgi:hypothetical protein